MSGSPLPLSPPPPPPPLVSPALVNPVSMMMQCTLLVPASLPPFSILLIFVFFSLARFRHLTTLLPPVSLTLLFDFLVLALCRT